MKEIFIQKELKQLIEELDVSDSNYVKATNRYHSIAKYLKNSPLSDKKPDIYLQGSFKLGTAIKPLSSDGNYDIDIVCNFTSLKKHDQSQFSLKQSLGEVLCNYSKSHSMSNDLEESKRCWTLKYVDEDNFHIDILPSVPLNDQNDGFIAITDKTKPSYNEISDDWETSNPKAYAEWFRNISEFHLYRNSIARRFCTSIEEVPEYTVKTPLQRIIQILKRHAEICFSNNLEFKPSSIIITTLAAKQYTFASHYSNDFFKIMSYIIENLKNGIKFIADRPCVLNPVNEKELLSGKWDKDAKYYKSFEDWIIQLNSDFNINNPDIPYSQRIQYIKRSLFKNNAEFLPIIDVKTIAHRKKSKWSHLERETVIIKANYLYKGFRWKEINSGVALNRNGELKFEVIANNIKDYEIWWQITNTGDEARVANCLRGDFYNSVLVEGKRIRKEYTAYVGHHFVEAYLIKNGVCYGKSDPFDVNIVSNPTFSWY
ncbi:nucleotidyltransferase [Mycoplasma simbae]|uniref:nucleotidyltransferase n=1 Tax=Mycoplasma simbae TaxID=36744 RepID=UPI000497EB79|nr:nucleotidyltransferase [Mycoplasma simbae]